MSSLCCTCQTDIVLKLKHSSDVSINLVQGEELSEAGELVKIALDVTLNPNTPFPLVVKNCYQFISNTEQKYSKSKEKFGKLEIRLRPNNFSYCLTKISIRAKRSISRVFSLFIVPSPFFVQCPYKGRINRAESVLTGLKPY